MKTIRRLYFYAVALISVEVVLWGTVDLLRSIFNANLVGNSYTLAGALAAIIVGAPIFLIHWLWAQSTSAKDDEEKTSSIRAIFLYGVLLATGIPAVQNLLALIDRTFLSTAHLYLERAVVGGSQTWSDNAIAIFINLLIAAYFWGILRGDWKTLPQQDDFTDVRRVARFIWMLYGLLMIVYGAQQAIDYAFTLSSTDVLGEMGRETAVNAIALLLIGSPIWYFAWRILQDALPDSAEKESPLRLGVLYLLSLGGVVTVLTTSGILLFNILTELFGKGSSWKEILQTIGNPISIGLPFAVIWAYYGKWLNQQFNFEENETRRAGKKRLYFYILSFIGLAVVFFGIASLLSLVVDLLFKQGYLSNGGFRDPLAGALSEIVIGLPLWLMTWRSLQMEGLDEGVIGDHTRRSIVRKTYLYLVIFAAVIGGMVSAGAFLYTIFTKILGAEISDSWNTITNQIQLFVLFVILLVYHLYVLRRDGEVHADELENKQSQFGVLVLDHDGKFGDTVKAAFTKQTSRIPVTVMKSANSVPTDGKFRAVVMPGSLAVNTPANIEAWIRSFNGSKLIVPDEAAGVYWLNNVEAAAESARALAEGQEIHPQSQNRLTSIWTTIAYVFAALFGCQLLFMLLAFGISLVTNF